MSFPKKKKKSAMSNYAWYILVVPLQNSLSKVLARHHPLKANCLANNRNASDLLSARLPAEKLNVLLLVS